MGKHSSGGVGLRPPAAVVLACTVLATGATLLPGAFAPEVVRSPAATCTTTLVRVVAAPAIVPAVRTILGRVQQQVLADGSCLVAEVQGRAPAEMLSALGSSGRAASVVSTVPGAVPSPPSARAADAALPDLWIPDSHVWADRLPATQGAVVDESLASSPVVLMTATAVTERLGWADGPGPRWADAVTGAHPVAADLGADSAGLATALALQATVPDEQEFRTALAALAFSVIPVSRPGQAAATDLLEANSAATPLIPTTEQAALALRRSGRDSLSLVYPRGGSPLLDHPLVRIGDPGGEGPRAEAVGLVSSALQSTTADDAYLGLGFRVADREPPAGVPARHRSVAALPVPTRSDVEGLVTVLTRLRIPLRMLAVIDVSTSMTSLARPGTSRIDVVLQAAGVALQQLPADSSVGAWVFASRLPPDGKDWKSMAPVLALDARDGTTTHRARLLERLADVDDEIRPGGTSIYDTVDAAVREMRRNYDGSADNVVVLFTDGANDDRRGLSLPQLLRRMRQLPSEQIPRLVVVGIGPGVDLLALRRLAEATPGGRAYVVDEPARMQTVLFDALVNRR